MNSNTELPALPEKSGRERSGKARMASLSAEERRDLAKRAAEQRWGRKDADPAFLIYQSEDRQTRIDVRIEDETVWLNQLQMAELFQVSKQNISVHIRNLYQERELDYGATVKEYLTVQREGAREVQRIVESYNLDVIISVGYRVKSQRGTQFRIWATKRLREYIVKGFTLDDERLKNAGTRNDYFDELLKRVREIRTSEKNFYRKITDLYATSIDYDPHSPTSQNFFAMVQNKFHYAVHGHTAAELIAERANASLEHMGLTSWEGEKIKKSDVSNAKNYLTQDELDSLNLLVDAYLSLAEFQAKQRRVMHMSDWAKKLDDFLKLSDREILLNAGRISAKISKERAEREYEHYSMAQRAVHSADASDFEKYVRTIQSQRSR